MCRKPAVQRSWVEDIHYWPAEMLARRIEECGNDGSRCADCVESLVLNGEMVAVCM
jgi:hypothetical protein